MCLFVIPLTCPSWPFAAYPGPQAAMICFLSKINLHFLEFNLIEFYRLFSYLLGLSFYFIIIKIIFRFIHVVSCISGLIPLYCWVVFYYTYMPEFAYCSSFDGQFGCFHVFITNEASLNVYIQIFIWHVLSLLLGRYLLVEWLDHIIVYV